MLNLLITLLVYVIVFAIVYYIVMQILVLMEVTAPWLKIAKLIMLVIALIVILTLFFGGAYVDLPRLKVID